MSCHRVRIYRTRLLSPYLVDEVDVGVEVIVRVGAARPSDVVNGERPDCLKRGRGERTAKPTKLE